MYSKTLLAAALVASLVLPAAAATTATKTKMSAKTYYAEQSVKSKFCYAVAFKPNGKTATMIGTDSFTSLSKALAALKADTDCKAPKLAMAKMKMTPKPKTVAKVVTKTTTKTTTKTK